MLISAFTGPCAQWRPAVKPQHVSVWYNMAVLKGDERQALPSLCRAQRQDRCDLRSSLVDRIGSSQNNVLCLAAEGRAWWDARGITYMELPATLVTQLLYELEYVS